MLKTKSHANEADGAKRKRRRTVERRRTRGLATNECEFCNSPSKVQAADERRCSLGLVTNTHSLASNTISSN